MLLWREKHPDSWLEKIRTGIPAVLVDHAHLEWTIARERLNWVSGMEETDYAIYALAAAEKKYGILLARAKLEWGDPAAARAGGV